MSRWWKCLPLLRILTLGSAFHAIWPRAAPKRGARREQNQGQAAALDGEELVSPGSMDQHWQVIHNFRLERTSEFLHAGNTTTTLLLILRAVSPAQSVMAWILARDGVAAKKRFDLQFRIAGDPDLQAKSKPEIVTEFMDPSCSPVWRAVSAGSLTLSPSQGHYWNAVLEYNRSHDHWAVQQIWTHLLPALAHVWLRVGMLTYKFPWRLLLMLSPDETVRRETSIAFYRLKPCCLPRGVRSLHAALKSETDLLNAEFTSLIKELAWALDLSIFDRECSHASTRAHIESSNGVAPHFESVCHASFGGDVWQNFVAEGKVKGGGQAAQAVRGRPRNPEAKKRARLDGWNVFVCENSVRRGAPGAREQIRSGAPGEE